MEILNFIKIYIKRNKSIIKIFNNLYNRTLFKINETAKKGDITNFEEKAFISFCASANITAKTYLSSEQLPYEKIDKVEEESNIFDAYLFLCVAELHDFFERLKNKKEINEIIDTSKEKIIKDFAKILSNEELKDKFEEKLNILLDVFDDKIRETNGDQRDLWYGQSIIFGNKLSNGKINFEDLMEEDISAKLNFSIISLNLHIGSAELFDSIVLGKKI